MDLWPDLDEEGISNVIQTLNTAAEKPATQAFGAFWTRFGTDLPLKGSGLSTSE